MKISRLVGLIIVRVISAILPILYIVLTSEKYPITNFEDILAAGALISILGLLIASIHLEVKGFLKANGFDEPVKK